MYPNNIYIQNHEEISKITINGNPVDIGVSLDIFDNAHGLKHDDLARAQYKHWRSIVTGADSLLSVNDKRLLDMK